MYNYVQQQRVNERIKMSRFTNKSCPVCEKRFSEKDDIVVCPECGTPHHRECYAKNNSCGLVTYHVEGFEWNGALPWESSKQEETVQQAPQDSYTPSTDESAATDKAELNALKNAMFTGMEYDPQQMLKEYIAMVNDDRITVDGISRKELYTFVNKSVMHYSTAFEMYRADPDKKVKVSVFNFCAGLFKPLHQFYRKMNWLAILLTLFDIVISLPMLLIYSGLIEVTAQNENLLSLLSTAGSFISFIVTILLCIFWNKLYYRHAVKKIKKIRARFHGERTPEYYEALAQSGKPSWLNVVVGFLFEALVIACVLYLPIIVA